VEFHMTTTQRSRWQLKRCGGKVLCVRQPGECRRLDAMIGFGRRDSEISSCATFVCGAIQSLCAPSTYGAVVRNTQQRGLLDL
jgi:hypothetical protein